MAKYKTRVVKKKNPDTGNTEYRVEYWSFHQKWTDTLRGWFTDEHEAYELARNIAKVEDK